tara:strand:- start:324 stop:629 length:306 start_codon:yes stop_codon:yes gene_type:complete
MGIKINNIKLQGTEFQIKVWSELKKIPAGKTKTYKEIATIIGHPKAARAVANACKRNPYPINIPCHRVIKSDGRLGGYSAPGGINKKKQLLKFEKEFKNIK